ncbi:EamA family transporter [Paracoccus pacificus]|uniref:EamA family transporter n=1 Tax=Paracoccus pacificus TaxID=1463598 RepID=A0ABW4R2C9_9RHOB
MIWVVPTLIAAAAQTARNAMQAGLTRSIGTLGATQVRFVFGLPFAVIFLLAVVLVTGQPVPRMGAGALGFTIIGATAQIAATALMLWAMSRRSFAVATAWIKTEPVMVAIFGVIALGDHLSMMQTAAILIATLGVVLISARDGLASMLSDSRPALAGIAAGALFGASAVGFRGAILGLDGGDQLIRATTTLVWALAMQTLMLGGWLLVFRRQALIGGFREWRASLPAGFMGALASQFWFLGFALTSAANVRTLALVEVIFAQIVSRRIFRQHIARRELAGMALIIVGVIVLVRS